MEHAYSRERWERFISDALPALEAIQENKLVHLDELSAFFKDAPLANDELREFLLSSVWEADANPREFEGLVKLFKSRPTELQLIEFMQQPNR